MSLNGIRAKSQNGDPIDGETLGDQFKVLFGNVDAGTLSTYVKWEIVLFLLSNDPQIRRSDPVESTLKHLGYFGNFLPESALSLAKWPKLNAKIKRRWNG